MNTTEALSVIEQALNNANLKGVYNLKDSSLIVQAINIIYSELNKNNQKDGLIEFNKEN